MIRKFFSPLSFNQLLGGNYCPSFKDLLMHCFILKMALVSLLICRGYPAYSDWVLSWTVRGSNSGGGEIFHTCPDRLWGLPSLF